MRDLFFLKKIKLEKKHHQTVSSSPDIYRCDWSEEEPSNAFNQKTLLDSSLKDLFDIMDAGETMVEVIRPTATLGNAAADTHEGIKQYYVQKIEELQVRDILETRADQLRRTVSFLVECGRERPEFTTSASETQ